MWDAVSDFLFACHRCTIYFSEADTLFQATR